MHVSQLINRLMAYLISILTAIGFLVGFFALSDYETRRGMRFFMPLRVRLDQDVEHITFILTHADFETFVINEVRHMTSRIGHTLVHFSLQTVRAAERLLTHLIQHLRRKHSVDTVPRESIREYVKTLSNLKDHLKTTRPEVPDIQ